MAWLSGKDPREVRLSIERMVQSKLKATLGADHLPPLVDIGMNNRLSATPTPAQPECLGSQCGTPRQARFSILIQVTCKHCSEMQRITPGSDRDRLLGR